MCYKFLSPFFSSVTFCKYKDSSAVGNFELLQSCTTINKTCPFSFLSNLQTDFSFDVIEVVFILDWLAGWAKKYTWDAINHIRNFLDWLTHAALCTSEGQWAAGRQGLTHSFLPLQLLSLVERHVCRRGQVPGNMRPTWVSLFTAQEETLGFGGKGTVR